MNVVAPFTVKRLKNLAVISIRLTDISKGLTLNDATTLGISTLDIMTLRKMDLIAPLGISDSQQKDFASLC